MTKTGYVIFYNVHTEPAQGVVARCALRLALLKLHKQKKKIILLLNNNILKFINVFNINISRGAYELKLIMNIITFIENIIE